MKTKQLLFAAIALCAVAFYSCDQMKTKDGAASDNNNNNAGATASPSADLEKNKQVMTDYLDAFNDREFDKLTALFADNYVYHGTDTTITGGAATVAHLKGFADAFNANVRLRHLFAEGDQVAYHIQVTGKHVAPLGPMPATNNDVDVESIGIVIVQNGKITEEWECFQQSKMMKQLSAPAVP